jgi:hypothetical protein
MRNNRNKNLYWYGFFANLKKMFGKLLIIIGIFALLIHWILSIILIICGIVLIAKGSSQRFDYKRQSGYIMHGGDR